MNLMMKWVVADCCLYYVWLVLLSARCWRWVECVWFKVFDDWFGCVGLILDFAFVFCFWFWVCVLICFGFVSVCMVRDCAGCLRFVGFAGLNLVLLWFIAACRGLAALTFRICSILGIVTGLIVLFFVLVVCLGFADRSCYGTLRLCLLNCFTWVYCLVFCIGGCFHWVGWLRCLVVWYFIFGIGVLCILALGLGCYLFSFACVFMFIWVYLLLTLTL